MTSVTWNESLVKNQKENNEGLGYWDEVSQSYGQRVLLLTA